MLTVDVYVSDHPKKKVINMYTNRKGLLVKNLCYLGVFMQKFERQAWGMVILHYSISPTLLKAVLEVITLLCYLTIPKERDIKFTEYFLAMNTNYWAPFMFYIS